MKKKILFLMSSMNIGGVEKSFLSLLNILPKEEYDITLILLEKKGGFLPLVPSYVKIRELKWYKMLKQFLMESPYFNLNTLIKEKKYIRAIKFIFFYYLSKKTNNRKYYLNEILTYVSKEKEIYDIGISYAGPTEILDLYLLKKIKARKKITWMHFDVSKIKVNEKLYRYMYEKYENIYAVSLEAKKKLINAKLVNSNKVKIFKNIIDENLIKKLSNEKIDNLYVKKDAVKIVTLGRLGLEKGQDIAIKVQNKLIKHGFNVCWYFIGEGLDKEYYKMLVKELKLEEEIIFLGEKANPYPYLKMADIYVQPSRHEGYCIALHEAKILEKLIITTNFTGAKEQIIDGYNGLLCEINEEDIYKKICMLLENKNLNNELKNNLKKEKI